MPLKTRPSQAGGESGPHSLNTQTAPDCRRRRIVELRASTQLSVPTGDKVSKRKGKSSCVSGDLDKQAGPRSAGRACNAMLIRITKNAGRFMLRRMGYDVVLCPREPLAHVRPEFRHLTNSAAGIQKLLDEFTFETVLDVGCGAGQQTDIFLKHGKQVTTVDYGRSVYFETNHGPTTTLIGEFCNMHFDGQYDCVWASHILEHQTNAGLFLNKLHSVTKEDGVICVTVPPVHHRVLGGHVSLWTGGLLLYNLVLAGFDCKHASILRYGFNITVIVKKRSVDVPDLVYDKGDVDAIAEFLPAGLKEGFDGNITRLNW
jgi:SAM-dependent methyltransferase